MVCPKSSQMPLNRRRGWTGGRCTFSLSSVVTRSSRPADRAQGWGLDASNWSMTSVQLGAQGNQRLTDWTDIRNHCHPASDHHHHPRHLRCLLSKNARGLWRLWHGIRETRIDGGLHGPTGLRLIRSTTSHRLQRRQPDPVPAATHTLLDGTQSLDDPC